MNYVKFIAMLMAVMVFDISCHPQQQSTLPNLHDGGIAVIQPETQGLPEINPTLDPDAGTLNLSNAGQNGEQIIPLRSGERAPFNGVLFNGPATAYIQVEFRTQAQRCIIDRQHDIALVVARYNADIESMNLALDTQRRMDQIVIDGRDQDIAALIRLNQEIQQNSRPSITNNLLWVGGGFLAGVIVVGGIVLFVSLNH